MNAGVELYSPCEWLRCRKWFVVCEVPVVIQRPVRWEEMLVPAKAAFQAEKTLAAAEGAAETVLCGVFGLSSSSCLASRRSSHRTRMLQARTGTSGSARLACGRTRPVCGLSSRRPSRSWA